MPSTPPAQLTEYRSTVARASGSTATVLQMHAVVAADEGFAFRLYKQLALASQDDVFLSPYSISTSLSMVLAGARGKTAQELAAALSVDDPGSWDPARNLLDLTAGTTTSLTPDQANKAQPLTLETANTMFGQSGYPFEQSYLDVLAKDYGGGVQAADFAHQWESARAAINGWVADQTEQRIKDLLAEGTIDDMTRAVLVNAIYFKGNWIHQFAPDATSTASFTLLDGTSVSVPTMHAQGVTLEYGSGKGWSAVELPYFGASMLVIVPDSGKLAEIETELTPDLLAKVGDSLGERSMTLSLPKWSTEQSADLPEALESLGVHLLFDPNAADLSGITTAEPLFISHVVHKANITVDEHGTEAAAATASVAEATSLPPSQTLSVDRPFIYLIRDAATNEILFIGRELDPR